jgi:3'(2'),5'-bisphosphate nucleotidase
MIDITKIEEISIEAGNAIMRLRQNGFSKSSKTDGSPVTEADLAADTIIIKRLAELAPDIRAITEETWTVEDDDDMPQYWCIDPIDGTKNFINGNADFTINIALIKKRFPVLGVIYAPALGTLWAGFNGTAWKRHAPLNTADASGQQPPHSAMTLKDLGTAETITAATIPTERPRVVATKAHRSPELTAWIDRLGAASSNAVGSSLKFCVIAEGQADLYPRIGATMEWDTAAGQAILEAAGGAMIDPDRCRFAYGKPMRLNGRFAAVGKIKDQIPESWIPPHSRIEAEKHG